jgi:hypothetical protein
MPAITQAIGDQVATLDYQWSTTTPWPSTAVAAPTTHCSATTPPPIHAATPTTAHESLSTAVARAEQALRAAAALGCDLPPNKQFCPVYGILTAPERFTFTSQPWIPDRLISQLAKQPAKATARYAALVHDLLTWPTPKLPTPLAQPAVGTGHGCCS